MYSLPFLLIPGFVTLYLVQRKNNTAPTYDGWKLVLLSLLTTIIMFIVPTLIVVFVGLGWDSYDAPSRQVFKKFWTTRIFPDHMSISWCVYFIYTGVNWWLADRGYWYPFRRLIETITPSSDSQLHDEFATLSGGLVMIHLRSDKVYVGTLTQYDILKDPKYIKLTIAMSGIRDENKRVEWTTFYHEELPRFFNFNEVVSIGWFDLGHFKKFTESSDINF